MHPYPERSVSFADTQGNALRRTYACSRRIKRPECFVIGQPNYFDLLSDLLKARLEEIKGVQSAHVGVYYVDVTVGELHSWDTVHELVLQELLAYIEWPAETVSIVRKDRITTY